jgi:hypothetical protein
MHIELLQGPSQIAASEVIAMAVPGGTASGTLNSSFNTTTFGGAKEFDTHNAFDGTTYTVPAPGLYQIYTKLEIGAASAAVANTIQAAVYKNGVFVSGDATRLANATVTGLTVTASALTRCNAGDLITIRALSTATTPSYFSSFGGNQISIHRLGGV